jgi:RNA polymerase sigma factor (sigma-70 family)
MTTEGEFNFRTTLREVKNHSKPVEALLEDPEFRRKGFMICHGLAPNHAIAEELFQTVSMKVWLKVMDRFVPDFTKPYGKFFAWFRKIARNTFFSGRREIDSQTNDAPVEDHLAIKDPRPNAEEELLRREREEQIWKHVKSLPRDRRLTVTLFLKGRSSRRSAKILNRLGIKCCHATVLNRVSKALAPFFPDGVPSFKKAS